MRGGKPTAWVAGTVVLVLVILGLGWVGLASPQFAQASAAQESTTSVARQNETLRARNAELRVQFDQLDELIAKLTSLRTGIPTTPEHAAMLREIEAAATANGVVITDLLVSPATVVDTTVPTIPPAELIEEPVAAAAGPEATEPAETPEVAETAPGDDAVLPEQPAAPLLEGFLQIPISVTVQGSYESVKAFLAALQEGIDRLVLVAGIAATSLEESAGDAALPPSVAGDVELMVSGVAYVLEDRAVEPAPGDPAPGEPAPLPPPTGVNPFLPVTGSAPQAPPAED